MKKIIALVLTALLALSLVACGSETKTDDADKTEDKTSTELTGTVSTDGSTSMEKVIGALSESFMAQNGGVTVNYNPTGSGSGITAVSQNPDAIGYASLASIKDTVKALNVDGVTPGEATVKDGSYLVQRPFVLVTVDGKALSPAAQAFFDYATSSDAASIIAKAGAVAVAD